jgi:hypothetical protein
VLRRRAEAKDDVWCWDFVFDRTTNGSPLKWLSIVDEFTRECLVLKVDRGITSEAVIDWLAELFAIRGVPRCIRSDNGPEFIAHAIRRWLGQVGVETLYIEPGSPWQNGYAESFHSRLRDEFLALEEFESLAAAGKLTAAWRDDYNHRRPHGSLGYVAPAVFAARCSSSVRPTASLQKSSGLPQSRLPNEWYRNLMLVTCPMADTAPSMTGSKRPRDFISIEAHCVLSAMDRVSLTPGESIFNGF